MKYLNRIECSKCSVIHMITWNEIVIDTTRTVISISEYCLVTRHINLKNMNQFHSLLHSCISCKCCYIAQTTHTGNLFRLTSLLSRQSAKALNHLIHGFCSLLVCDFQLWQHIFNTHTANQFANQVNLVRVLRIHGGSLRITSYIQVTVRWSKILYINLWRSHTGHLRYH